MALQKTKKLRTGATGNYWEPREIILRDDLGAGYVMLALYVDKKTRDDPKMTFLDATKRIDFTYTKEEIGKDLYGFINKKIKENDFFIDAIDILE